jgi:hypothetical protein
VLFDRVAQGKALANFVPISTTRAHPLDVASLLEFPENTLHCAFRNSDLIGDISHARFRCVDNANQHVGVIREESPLAGLRFPSIVSVHRFRLTSPSFPFDIEGRVTASTTIARAGLSC